MAFLEGLVDWVLVRELAGVSTKDRDKALVNLLLRELNGETKQNVVTVLPFGVHGVVQFLAPPA